MNPREERREETRELIFIFYRIEKGRRRREWLILVAARCISQRVTRGDAADRFLTATRRREKSLSPRPGVSAEQLPSPLDMKVQQGCNSADMGIPVRTEEELRRNSVITPEDVLGLQKITKSK